MQGGGFTVFGLVVGNGMEVVDAIAALDILNASGVFPNLPVIDHTPGEDIVEQNLVMTEVSLMADPVSC